MSRVRISTTVDGDRLSKARELLPLPDSELIDRALNTLIDEMTARREIEILQAMPYETDPDLTWTAPSGPALPYDGEIPPEVEEQANRRRR